MKLYTEEQILKFINDNFDEGCSNLNELSPIEVPSDQDIWIWWQTQKFQKENGEQEYTMLYEIDLPKILKAFIKTFKTK